MFTFYVNDLASCVNSSLLSFADDIKLFCCIRSETDVVQLQHDINALLEWSKSWLLSLLTFLNVNIYELVQGLILQHIQYTLDGVTIDSVVRMRDLGVIIDSDLKFHSHVSKLNIITYKQVFCLQSKESSIYIYSSGVLSIKDKAIILLYITLSRGSVYWCLN